MTTKTKTNTKTPTNLPNAALDAVQGKMRTVSFGGNVSDPYILFHNDEDALSDRRIEQLYTEWLAESRDEPEDDEDFEKFLDRLEAEHDYRSVRVADRMFHVDEI